MSGYRLANDDGAPKTSEAMIDVAMVVLDESWVFDRELSGAERLLLHRIFAATLQVQRAE